MARVIAPGPDTAALLAGIARAAFDRCASRWSAADFLMLGDQPGVVVLVDDGADKALLILRVAVDEAEILDFGVVPAARRRGLGRELLSAAEALAGQRGAACVFLEVAVDNIPARALYARGGYTEQGRRKGYYQRPGGIRADALILKKMI